MKYDYTVAQDGSGDFTTLQEAQDAADKAGLKHPRINVKPGNYPTNPKDVTFKDCTIEGNTFEGDDG